MGPTSKILSMDPSIHTLIWAFIIIFQPQLLEGGLLGYAKIGDKTKLGIEIGLNQ
jgi:hypothetical protein